MPEPRRSELQYSRLVKAKARNFFVQSGIYLESTGKQTVKLGPLKSGEPSQAHLRIPFEDIPKLITALQHFYDAGQTPETLEESDDGD